MGKCATGVMKGVSGEQVVEGSLRLGPSSVLDKRLLLLSMGGEGKTA
jgi:hypothetical protein